MKHLYGPRVHLVDNPLLGGLLAQLCSPETFQPKINRLVEILYTHLISVAMNEQMTKKTFVIPTRMTPLHPEAQLQGEYIEPQQKAICVNLARAGTYPSHICYDFLHNTFPPQQLRQDHIFAARMTDAAQHVTGAEFGGMKIGGGIKDSYVFFPDPMGATGNTIVSSVQFYKDKVEGPAKKYIALHLIVTPEYLKKTLTAHPDIEIYALRLDRGLSSQEVLQSIPGTYWDQEKGLDGHDYIVPGGGGFGEIMNNSFV